MIHCHTMSYSEFDDWNPMEEDFKMNSLKFPGRKSFNEEFDELCLFVKNIPVDITQDVFYNVMSDGGRHVTRVMLNTKIHPNSHQTYGFAHFATHEDAVSALNALNGTPPFKFHITFAKRRKESESKNHFTNHLNITETGREGTDHDMEYSKSTINQSPNLKVVAAEAGRTVLMKLPESLSSETSLNSTIISVKKTLLGQTPASSAHKLDCHFELVSNPFYFCFQCKKEGAKLCCSNCKKPYCSSSCQVIDWVYHKYLCKVAKGVSESLLESYKHINIISNENNYISGNSSSDCENCLSENTAIKNIKRQSNENRMPLHISNSLSSTNSHALKVNAQLRSVQNFKADNFSDKRKPLIDRVPHINALKTEQIPIEKIYLTAGQIEKIYIINVESPSRFWVQLDKFSSTLLNLEKELLCIEKDYIQNVHPNVFCCLQHCDKIFRGEILKEKSPSEVLVYLLDYGKTLTVLKSNLFQLPEKFRSYPMQAVCCKLVDEKLNFQWNEEDSKLFQLYADNKHYKARILKSLDEINEVSLINEDGITLYSILAEVKGTTLKPADSVTPSDNVPPSIWSILKSGTRLNLIPAFMAENFYWCYLAVNKSDLQEVIKIEKLLENYSAEDITKCAEEGDFAAGFSLEYQQFYRCVILKRRHKSFLVRYIDYGNEEEITCLNILSPELFQTCCYCVKCEKPPSLSKDDFNQFIMSNDVEVVVIKAERDVAELSFNSSKQYIVQCYPCFSSYCNVTENVFMKSPLSAIKYLNISPKYTTKSSIFTISNSNTAIKQVIGSKAYVQKVMEPKSLSINSKYNVKVVFMKTVAEVFVQLNEKETEMNIMFAEFNKYCNSKYAKYVPKVGEIVCCKFSDGLWYRGLVKEKVNKKYNILFVDYGNEDFVLPNDIQSLPDKFICPKYSICVSLSGIKNEDISSCFLKKLLKETWDMQVIDNKKSPIEVILFLKGIPLTNLVGFEKSKIQNKSALKHRKLPAKQKLEIKVTHEDNKYLYLHQVKDIKALEEMTAKLNSLSPFSTPKNPIVNNIYCGLFRDGSWYRVLVHEKIAPDLYKVLFIDYGNYADVSVNNLKEIPDDLLTLPVFCASVIVQNRDDLNLNLNDQYTVEVVGMKHDIQMIQFLNFPKTSINLPIISSFKRQQLSDELNDILVCHAENGISYGQLSSDESNVLDLFKTLQKSSKECKSPSHLNVGDVISALSPDGFWYRASILSNEKAPSYKVMYFDYGNTEFVNIKNIKCLPQELVNIPVFSIPMEIENIEDVLDADIFTKSLSVKKIKLINDVYIVQIIMEKNINLPKISSIEKMLLPSNSSLKVSLCHNEDDVFFVQLLSKELEQLTECLVEADKFKSLLEMPQVNDVICTKFTDGVWYRSCVQELFVSTNSLKVLFFDFGNSETVTFDNVKVLPPELCSYPIFSIPIKFRRYEPVEEILMQGSCVFEVMVIDMDKNIQIIDVISDTEKIPANTYKHFYFSSLKAAPLPLKENFKVIFKNHFDNYYIAIKYECDEIYKLSSLLQNADIITFNHVPSVEEVLLIRKDNLQYRGCIKEIDINKNVYKVYFIDSGITEDLHNPEMYELPESCKSFPMFAMKVLVESDEPLMLEQPYHVQYLKHSENGTPVLKVYHHHMISSIAHQTLPLNEVRSVIFYHRENDILFLQDLSDADLITEVQTILSQCSSYARIPYKPVVGELVVAMSQCDNSWYRGSVVDVLPFDTYKIFFIDFGNSELIQEQNLQIISYELTKFAKFCIPVKFSDNKIADSIELEKMYLVVSETKTSNNVQIIHLAFNEDVEITEVITDEKIVNACNRSENQEFKFTMCKYVAFASGEQDIAIYNVDEDLNVFCAPFNQNNIIANIDLTHAITEYCSSKATSFATGSEPEVGDMVLAKFSGDGQWYRAVVIDVSDHISSSYNVHFTDYGNSEHIDISCLKKMDKQFMTLDIQAHMCTLIGFKVLKENISNVYEKLKKFTVFASSESLTAHVQKIGNDITVNVPRITAHLVKENLAVVSI